MATLHQAPDSTEAVILSRLIQSEQDDYSPSAAEALLRLRLTQQDIDRLHAPVAKNQADALTKTEKAELESYLRVSSFLDLMHAKARSSLGHGAELSAGPRILVAGGDQGRAIRFAGIF